MRAGISQQQLGEIVGVSQQSINKYENHNVEPDVATLCALADYFQTSVDYLVGHTQVDHVIDPSNDAISIRTKSKSSSSSAR